MVFSSMLTIYLLAHSDFPKGSSTRNFRPDTRTIFPLFWLSDPVIPITVKKKIKTDDNNNVFR